MHDKKGAFAAIRDGLFKLSQLTLGANAIVQSALPAILAPEPGSADAAALEKFHTETVAQLEENAAFTVERMTGVPGLRVVEPQGAMYVMIGIDTAAFKDIADDVDFTQKLLTEESVFMLPGQAFRMPMFARIVFSVSALRLSRWPRLIALPPRGCLRAVVAARFAAPTLVAAPFLAGWLAVAGSQGQAGRGLRPDHRLLQAPRGLKSRWCRAAAVIVGRIRMGKWLAVCKKQRCVSLRLAGSLSTTTARPRARRARASHTRD